MHRRQLLPCLAAAAVAGCRRKPPQPRKLRAGLIPRFTLSPLYLADELGFFRQAGLEVEMRPFPEAAHMLPPLAAGLIDAGFIMPMPGFINAVLKGSRMSIVAARDLAAPGCGSGGAIFGNRKAFPNGLRDLRLLKGKRVAIPGQTGLPAFYLDQLLASVGLTRADVQPVIMRQPEAAAAVASGQIDALAAAHMDKDLDYVSGNVIRSVTLSEIMPNYQYSFIVFGPTLLEGGLEAGVSFLWAYLRGVQAYRAGHSPRALEELARATRSDPAAARAACRDGISADGSVDPVSVQRFVDWAVTNGYVPRAVEASLLIDTRFVEEANRRLSRQTGARK